MFCAVIVFLVSCTASLERIEGHVYYRLNANPTTLDPALIADVSGASIAAKLFNGLVRLGDDLEILPDIAERWEISKDGKRYKFSLKKGVRFSNGHEVKAKDFKYSFERVLNPGMRSPNTWVFDKISGASEFQQGLANEVIGLRVSGDYVFEIILRKPFSPFLSMLTTTPAYVVPEEDVKRWSVDFSSHPSGTGPFVLKGWKSGGSLILQANERYFDGKVRIRGIVYRIIPEDLTAVTEFELGNIDVISLSASAYSKFRNDKKWGRYLASIKGLNTYYLGMNTSRPPFNDPELRTAVSHAIDRKKILETFYEGRGRLALGPVPDMLRMWDLRPDMTASLHYAPETAKRIIKTKGLSDTSVNMYVTADQDVVDLSEIIQSYLSASGMNVKIKQLEWSAYKEAINKGEPDMFWLSWWADYPDPENFLFPLFHSSNFGPAGNRTRYANKKADSLIEQGQYALNEKDRNGFYKKAEEIIIKESPWVSFWHRTDFLVIRPRIKGYRVYPIYTMDKGMDVRIER
ncbi:MAG TPA: hypothetical protein DHW81_02635 [Nitrospiraceae bacterium]|nr:hypothetical protein [Nitrospiraceae bacterium]